MEHFLKYQAHFPKRKFNAISPSFKAPNATILLPLVAVQLPQTRGLCSDVPQGTCLGGMCQVGQCPEAKNKERKKQ